MEALSFGVRRVHGLSALLSKIKRNKATGVPQETVSFPRNSVTELNQHEICAKRIVEKLSKF